MNTESLHEHLAIKVMGAKVIEGRKHKIYDFPSGELIYASLWNPPENIEQAMNCLDAITTDEIGWSLYKNCKPQKHVCKIYKWVSNKTKKMLLGIGIDHEKAMAVFIALVKATGSKE